MRDGSAIVRAIGDYANYRQRQEQIEYARDQQDYENRINERRLAMDEHRQNARLSMQMDEAEYRNSERQRIADERAAAQKAREGYRDSMMAELNASEQKAFAAIGAGASGQGQGVEVIDDGDDIILGVKKGEGRVDPFTKNPHDQNSPPFRIPKANVGEARQHAARSAEIAEANGATPEETAAYIRAGFTVGDDGKARPASESEFMANLKEQGLLDAMKGKFVDSDVPIDVGNGGESEQAKKDAFKGVVGHGKELYEAGNRGARQMYNTFIRGDWLVSSGISDHVRKTGSYVLFGDQAKVKLTKNDEATVRPTNSINTPKGVEDLQKTRRIMEENGGGLPKPSAKTKEIAQKPTVEDKTHAVRERFSRIRDQYAAVGELYVTGQIDERAMANFMETGDMRFNKYDLEKHRVTTETASSQNKARVLKAEKALLDSQIEAAKATRTNFEDGQKMQKQTREKLTQVGKDIARVIGNRKGYDPQQMKALEGEVATLATRFLANKRYSAEAAGTEEFAAMWSHAIESYINAEPNGDLSVMSITPYVTTVEGKYKPQTANTIKEVSLGTGNKMMNVRDTYNADYMEQRKAFHEAGLEWTAEAQADFDELFKEKFVNNQ